MDSFTHTPSGHREPDAPVEAALTLLREKVSVDFTAPYTDRTDQRHDLAVLAVDLGRRFLDLRAKLNDQLDVDLVAASLLNKRVVQAGAPEDFSQDHPEGFNPALVVGFHARLAEVDRTLRVLTVAYKQAWWSGMGPAAETAAT